MEIRETNLTSNFYKFDKAKYLTGVFLKAKNHGIISGDGGGGGSYIRKRIWTIIVIWTITINNRSRHLLKNQYVMKYQYTPYWLHNNINSSLTTTTTVLSVNFCNKILHETRINLLINVSLCHKLQGFFQDFLLGRVFLAFLQRRLSLAEQLGCLHPRG
jgi:hypothetical protein